MTLALVRTGMFALALILAAMSEGQASGRVAILLVGEDYSTLGPSAVGAKRGLEIADLLRARGFEVVFKVNPTNASARATIGDFLAKVKGSELAIVLLIGHGVSASGQTFFLPKNATIERSSDLLSQGLSISNLMRIASMSKVADVCFLMTVPSLPVGLDDVDLRPRIDGDIPANVAVAFSSSSRMPVSRIDGMAIQGTDSLIALLHDNPHASLREFSNDCASDSQGVKLGEAPDIDLTPPPVAMALAQPPAVENQPSGGQAPGAQGAPNAMPPAPEAASAVPPTSQAPAEPMPLDIAVKSAATSLLSQVPHSGPGAPPREIVIDPLIVAPSGERNAATTKIAGMISDLVKDSYKDLTVAPFRRGEIAKRPLTLIGALQTVNSLDVAEGPADAFWICLALIDLQTGKIVSRVNARAWTAGVDTTLDTLFKDSPIRSRDEATTAYVRSCQASKVGDSLGSGYLDRIVVDSVIGEAIDAYDAKRYSDAADLARTALGSPVGDQFRAYDALYLASWRLNREDDAKQAFAGLVDHGLTTSNGVAMFLFEPNSTVFDRTKGAASTYDMWLKAIAARGVAENACLHIVGHASRTGVAEANDRLSAQRAGFVRDRLIALEPSVAKRTLAKGVGSKETVVRSDSDGPDNAIDRRVELKLVKCEQGQ